ncbi:hypothetical protein [Ureibacillus aquaedulcis]|uniref:Uncharacterized protein n=1 Tax=Ureibacillus aquaedulcis TaxID=3058421 RepID=A0ABT8GPP1_9BACL|nr:hypothetical protein [Ureibacillus sp. BA0131]MDN4492881.1 hypothetical protein [Ureibacillus sp. BA0131]
MEFHETVNGRRYYENYVPRITKALETIASELEKFNEDEDLVPHETFINMRLESIAKEIAPFEPSFARLLREYIR